MLIFEKKLKTVHLNFHIKKLKKKQVTPPPQNQSKNETRNTEKSMNPKVGSLKRSTQWINI